VMKNGRRMGAPPKPYQPPATPTGKVNVTDPDSRNVKTPRGYMQGYNVQAAVNEQQIVIAAEVTIDSPDFGHLDPMVIAVEAELIAAGLTDPPEVTVADAGYWHQVQMQAIVERGIQVLVPPDAGKRKTPRPGWEGGAYAFMRRVLATDHGMFNRRIDRFQRRGRSAARSEWRLITATHNLLKLHKHQTALTVAYNNTPARGQNRHLNPSRAEPLTADGQHPATKARARQRARRHGFARQPRRRAEARRRAAESTAMRENRRSAIRRSSAPGTRRLKRCRSRHTLAYGTGGREPYAAGPRDRDQGRAVPLLGCLRIPIIGSNGLGARRPHASPHDHGYGVSAEARCYGHASCVQVLPQNASSSHTHVKCVGATYFSGAAERSSRGRRRWCRAELGPA